MKENPKYSIIIPVYNSASFLSKCLDSLIAQKNPDWEAIVVNDGSEDGSWSVMQDYSRLDGRFRCFQRENNGAGATRNFGIEQAKGEWTLFLDSDDYLDADYLQLLEPKTKNADVVFIDVLRVTENGKILENQKTSVFKDLSIDSLLRSQMTGKTNWGGCRKCMKTQILHKYNIRYSLAKNGEEALFSFRILEAAGHIDFISEKPVYYYVEHQDSLSSVPVPDPWGEAVKLIRDYLLESGAYGRYADTLNAFNVAATIVSIDKLTQLYNGEKLKERINERVEAYFRLRDKDFAIDTEHLVWKARCLYPMLERRTIWPIVMLSRLRRILKLVRCSMAVR